MYRKYLRAHEPMNIYAGHEKPSRTKKCWNTEQRSVARSQFHRFSSLLLFYHYNYYDKRKSFSSSQQHLFLSMRFHKYFIAFETRAEYRRLRSIRLTKAVVLRRVSQNVFARQYTGIKPKPFPELGTVKRRDSIYILTARRYWHLRENPICITCILFFFHILEALWTFFSK